MKSSQLAALAALASLLAAAPLAAQQAPDTFRLKELVVTATKTPTPLAAVPAHVTVIGSETLRATGSTRVVDALRSVAGITIAQLGAPGAVASLFLRGGESDYVQVLVDGVQVNDPGGSFDWAHLTTADVERIEIVRGPVSVLYGSDAVAGVVQIFTRRGAGAPRVQAEVNAGTGDRVGAGAEGSYALWNASAAVTGAAGRVSWSLGGARQQSEGAYAFNSEYANTTLAGRAAFTRGSATQASLAGRWTDQSFHYPTDGAGRVVDRNRYTFGESYALAAGLAQQLGARVSLHAGAGLYRNDTGGEDPEDSPGQGFSRSSAEVTRRSAELRLDAEAPAGVTASLGAELEQQRGATTFDSDGPFGPYSDASANRRGSRALFAQLVRSAGRVGLTAGARVDDSDQFGAFTTARAGVSVQATEAVRVHAAYGTGFKEPTFFETYATGFARGNPDLAPEQSRSAEVGVRAVRGSAHVALSAFDQEFTNLIQYNAAAASPAAPSYENVGAAQARGVEAELGAAGRRTSASASYTYLATKVLDDGFGGDRAFRAGEPLLRRPAHQFGVTLAWRPVEAVRASIAAQRVGERADLDFTDESEWQGKRVVLDGYTRVDVNGSWRLPLRVTALELVLNLRNALDREYAEVYNFPAPGRVVTIGVRTGY